MGNGTLQDYQNRRDFSSDIEQRKVFPTNHPFVNNEDGTQSNVVTSTVGFGDKTLVIPTMVDGKQLDIDEAISTARSHGLDKYPSFSSEEDANRFSQNIHDKIDERGFTTKKFELEQDYAKRRDYSFELETKYDHKAIHDHINSIDTDKEMSEDEAERMIKLYYASQLNMKSGDQRTPDEHDYLALVHSVHGENATKMKKSDVFKTMKKMIVPEKDPEADKYISYREMDFEKKWEEARPDDSYDRPAQNVSAFGVKVGDDVKATEYSKEEQELIVAQYENQLRLKSPFLTKLMGKKILSPRMQKLAFDLANGVQRESMAFEFSSKMEQDIFPHYLRSLNPEIDVTGIFGDDGLVGATWNRMLQTEADGRESRYMSLYRGDVFDDDLVLNLKLKEKDILGGYDFANGKWYGDVAKEKAQEYMDNRWLMKRDESPSFQRHGTFEDDKVDVDSPEFHERMQKGNQDYNNKKWSRLIDKATRDVYDYGKGVSGVAKTAIVEGTAMLTYMIPVMAGGIVGGAGGSMFMSGSEFYGRHMDDLIYDNGLDISKAQINSLLVSIPYSMSEHMQVGRLAKLVKAGKLSKKNADIAGDMFKKFPSFVKDKFIPMFKELAPAYVYENSQEFAQGVIERAGRMFAKEYQEAEGITFDGEMESLMEEMKMSAQATLLPVIGARMMRGSDMKGGAFGNEQEARNIAEKYADLNVMSQEEANDIKKQLTPDLKVAYNEAQTFEEKQEVLDDAGLNLKVEQVEQFDNRERIVEELADQATADIKKQFDVSEQEAQSIVENDLDTFVQSRAKATKYAKILKHADIEQTGADTFTITGKEGGASTNLKLVESLDEKGHYDIASDTLVLPKNAENFTFTHEFTHAMVDKGLVTKDEFNQLLKYGNKLMKKQGIAGFADADAIKTTYQEKFNKVAKEKGTEPVQVTDDIINNEIVAMAMEEGRAKGDAPVEVRNIAQRVLDWVSSMIGYTTQSQKQRQLVQDVFEGKPLQGKAQDVKGGVRYSISQVDDKYDDMRVGTAKLGKKGAVTEQTSNITSDIVPRDVLERQLDKFNYDHLPKEILSEKDYDVKKEKIIEWVKDNLLHLHDHFQPHLRGRATKWYDGANVIARSFAENFGISQEQASGIIAVLSPQKDWFMNVAQAEQAIDILKNNSDVKISMDLVGKELEQIIDAGQALPSQKRKAKKGETKRQKALRQNYNKKLDQAEKDKRRNLLEPMIGKSLNELIEQEGKDSKLVHWAIRVMAQSIHGRYHNIISPEGQPMGIATKANGDPQKNTWGSTNEIKKLVSIFYDGSIENISENLGSEHKVRNFYNNIVAPNNKHGDATIDTHAVSAGHLMPYGASAIEVLHNFGGKGIPNSKANGISGLYHLYLDAYKRASEERGIMPRQMQSITWEAVRLLFPVKNANITNQTKDKWNNEKQDQARRDILGGELPAPSWGRAGNDQRTEGISEGLQESRLRYDTRGDLLFRGRTGERFSLAPPTDSNAFKDWSGGGEIIEHGEISDYKFTEGEPVVMKLYHGTTHADKLFEFKGEELGNKEGYFGAINYFTSSKHDADTNYLSEGADLTNRIQARAEEIASSLEYDPYIDGISEEEAELIEDGDPDVIQEISERLASEDLKGSQDKVLELYVRVDNPLVFGGQHENWIDAFDVEVSEEAKAEAREEIIDEYGIDEDEASDYEGEILGRALENEGVENKILEAVNEVIEEYDIEEYQADNLRSLDLEYGEFTGQQLMNLFRDDLADIQDMETGSLIGTHIFSQIVKKLGFDSIILNNADTEFGQRGRRAVMGGVAFAGGGMDMEHDTTHVHIFDKDNAKIKSADENVGSFDPSTSDIRYSVAPPTDSKAFKDWFGDSKVVNEDGSPMVVYHGTPYGRFNEQNKQFNRMVDDDALIREEMSILRQLGNEVYERRSEIGSIYRLRDIQYSNKATAKEKAEAEEKIARYDGLTEQWKNTEAEVDALRSKLKTYGDQGKVDESEVFRTTVGGDTDTGYLASGAYFSGDRNIAEEYSKSAGSIRNVKRDAYVYEGYLSIQNPFQYGVVSDEMADKVNESYEKYYKYETQGTTDLDKMGLARTNALRQAMIDHGFDGQIGDYGQGVEYVSFYPEQIKSATDNVGTYDPSNPDIRYAMKPLANAEVLASTYIASKQAEGKPLTDAEIEDVMEAFDIKDSSNVLENVSKIVDDEDDSIKKATHTSTMRKAIATKANKLAYQDRIRGIATDAKKGGAIYQQAEDRLKRNKLLERELNIQNIKEDKLRDVVDAYKSAIIDDQTIDNLPQIEEAIKQEMVKSGLISNRNQKGFKRMPEYRSTLKRTLKDIALELISDLSPSSRKTQLNQQARNLMNYTTTPSIENNFNKLLDKISSSVIKQTQQELREGLNKTLKPYAKRPKVDVEERKRTVAGQQHLMLFYANKYKGLSDDKYNQELSEIQSELEKYRDSDQPSEQILFNELEIREQALVAFGSVDTARSKRSDVISSNDYAQQIIEDGKAITERLDQAHRSKFAPITEDIQDAIEQAKPYVKKRDDKTLVDGLSQMHVRGQLESITAYGTDEQKASLEKVLLANDASKIKKIQLIEEYNRKLIEGVAEIGVDNFDKYQRESSIEKDEYKKYSHEGRTALSDADLMTMHMAFRQPDIVERALRVNESGELMNPDLKRRYDMWDAMKQDLGAVNIKVAEFMGDLIDEILPQVNETYKKQFGIDLKVQPANYFPLKVQVKKGGFKMYMSGIASAPSFTIARTQNTNDLNERSNIFEVFAGHISDASHYVNTYESSIGIRSTLTNRFTREAIRQTYGDSTLTYIDDSVVDMVADRPVVSGESNRSIDTVRSWMSNISIGNNPKSILVALTGTVNAFAVRRGIIDATTSALRNPQEAMNDIKFIYDSIVVQQRKELGINEGMQMARSRAKSSGAFVKAYTDLAYFGLTTMDSWISSVMGGVIYNQYKNSEQAQGLTQEQIEANGLAIVNRFVQEAYQPTSNDFMPADIRRGGSFAKSIFQFLTEPKSKLGIYIKDLKLIKAKYDKGDKQGASRDAVRLVIGQHILIPTAYWMAGELMRLWTGDDDEGALDRLVVAILSGPASGLLVWGTGIEIIFKLVVGDKVFMGSSIPSDRIMQEIQFIIKNATSDEEILEKVDNVIEKLVPVYKKTKQSLEN